MSRSWISGAPSRMAASGSNTAGSSSYSTSMRPIASSAVSSSTAATAATASPTWRAFSWAKNGQSLMIAALCVYGASRPVTTARTPMSRSARDVSMLTIRACGRGLRRILACNMPGNFRSTP